VGFGIPRANADFLWDPVYDAFHRVFGCGNETVLRQYCRRDLEASNLRSALEQGCGRHTTSAAILFFHKNLVYVLEIKT